MMQRCPSYHETPLEAFVPATPVGNMRDSLSLYDFIVLWVLSRDGADVDEGENEDGAGIASVCILSM
jgi:hypothetical protein